jgi:hypothetical protein
LFFWLLKDMERLGPKLVLGTLPECLLLPSGHPYGDGSLLESEGLLEPELLGVENNPHWVILVFLALLA